MAKNYMFDPDKEYEFSPDVDYGSIIKQQLERGAAPEAVMQTLGQRVTKSKSDPSLNQYMADDITSSALHYINSFNKPDMPAPSAPSYSSGYDGAINSLLGQLMGGGKFEYDHTTDPMYKALEDVYTTKGQRAMKDTAGEVSARTGGLASSYATSAGSQAYNYFMDQLGEKIPALRNQAYSEYQGDRSDKYNQLNALLGLDNRNYGRFRDTVGDSQWQQTFGANQAQQALDNQRYDTQYADSRADTNFSKAQTLINMGFNSADIAGALGITEQEAQTYINKLNAKGSGGGGYVGGAGGTAISDLYAAMSANPQAAYGYLAQNYREYGLTASQVDNVYAEWQKIGNTNSTKQLGAQYVMDEALKMLMNGYSQDAVADYVMDLYNKGKINNAVLDMLDKQLFASSSKG